MSEHGVRPGQLWKYDGEYECYVFVLHRTTDDIRTVSREYWLCIVAGIDRELQEMYWPDELWCLVSDA